MKIRDYVFWTCLTLSSITMGAWLRSSPAEPFPAESLSRLRPPSFVDRVTYWLAIARLVQGPPQMQPPTSQELPDEVVNAPPMREIGPDGEPLLAHGHGW